MPEVSPSKITVSLFQCLALACSLKFPISRTLKFNDTTNPDKFLQVLNHLIRSVFQGDRITHSRSTLEENERLIAYIFNAIGKLDTYHDFVAMRKMIVRHFEAHGYIVHPDDEDSWYASQETGAVPKQLFLASENSVSSEAPVNEESILENILSDYFDKAQGSDSKKLTGENLPPDPVQNDTETDENEQQADTESQDFVTSYSRHSSDSQGTVRSFALSDVSSVAGYETAQRVVLEQIPGPARVVDIPPRRI